MVGAQRHSRNMRGEAAAAIPIFRRRLFFAVAATDSEVGGSEGKPQPITHEYYIFHCICFIFFFRKLRFSVGLELKLQSRIRRERERGS